VLVGVLEGYQTWSGCSLVTDQQAVELRTPRTVVPMRTKSQGRRGQTAAVELDPVAMFTLIVRNVENVHHDFQSVP